MLKTNALPVYAIPHGGGPWPWMKNSFGDPAPFDALELYLQNLGRTWHDQIKALLVISAHWEAAVPTVHFGSAPPMLYDYGGFPDFAYHLQWPAPGAPQLAERVEGLVKAAGFSTAREYQRGYDHGTFIPLMLAFPQADIPVVQLSLMANLDPAKHWDLGVALSPLRQDGVLIIASGMSYHNLGNFFKPSAEVAEQARAFDSWLNSALALANAAERRQALMAWEQAPFARNCHPREEHLLPLMVAAGAGANSPGRVDFQAQMMGTAISGHQFA